MNLKIIKKLTYIIIFLIFQNTNCDDFLSEKKVKEFVLRNGINVILHENFRMPIALVGVVFHVGSTHAPIDKNGVTELVSSNLINKKMHDSFLNAGILYEVSVSDEYTEIFAKMNPKKIKEFFNQICVSFSDISIENFKMYKKQMVIKNKLNNYFLSNALRDNIFSNINPNNIFNESSLRSITEDDVISFYENKFRTCKVSIIVVGSIDYRNLIKILRGSISNTPNRKQKVISKNDNKNFKDTVLESKHMRNSMRYLYSTPFGESKKTEEIFLNILHHEVFRFFCKSNSLLSYYDLENIFHCENSFWLLSLLPKKDISINELKTYYNVFTKKMATISLEHTLLSRIAALKKIETQILLSNLFAIYQNIKNAYMRGLDLNSIYTISDDIKHSDPEKIKSFAEKFFHKSLISTITTRFRSDK